MGCWIGFLDPHRCPQTATNWVCNGFHIAIKTLPIYLAEIQSLFIWFEHSLTRAFAHLIQTLQVVQINFLEQAVLDTQFESIIDIGRLMRTAMLMIVVVWHFFLPIWYQTKWKYRFIRYKYVQQWQLNSSRTITIHWGLVLFQYMHKLSGDYLSFG